ncbi:NOL1/NOP2/sun family protein [Chlamydia trachomatis]|nr:NOL1/NOP2/sun family protein [Chlamydia trachomatis]
MLTLPESFERRLAEQFGVVVLSQLRQALASPLASSIRLHPTKSFRNSLRAVPWCSLGRYVGQPTLFGADPLWHAGAYYVQEASSMILAQFIQQLQLTPSRAIDLCAAPGGKSTLLRSYFPEDTLLISNEIETKRAQALLENITRFGLEETIVTSSAPQKLRATGLTADLILVDAPCSGEGMFRKEPAAIENWSESNVALCVRRQREILDEAWMMLEEGGCLIYSTCTYNRDENEEQLHYLQSKYALEVMQIDLTDEWGIWEREEGVYSLMPHRVEGEGLTIFAVRKRSGARSSRIGKAQKVSTIPPFLSALFKPDNLYEHHDTWYCLSKAGQEALSLLKGVQVLAGGVALGTLKGKDFLPAHTWASSAPLATKSPFPRYEATREEALQFLRREALNIQSEKGINLLTYQDIPLGFIKQVGNRANNLYPRDLALRNSTLTINDFPNWTILC